jgi:hypothetical protein
MRKLILAPVLAALIMPALAAQTPAAVRRTMTCPIGGEKFQFTTVSSILSWGERPDGKPYGTFPLEIPECPKNGLILYKDYEPQEVTKLEPLVASDAYQALRKSDVPFYRAYWLMGQMGLAVAPRLIALQRAIWAADAKPELRARYLAEFVEETAKQPRKPEDINWIGMEGRAVNALRELGRFDEASARLAKLPLSALAVAEPKVTDRSPAANQARARRNWHSYLEALKPVIARRDASAEPFDMLPKREWTGRCIDGKGLNETQQAHCTAQAAVVEEARAARTREDAELKALSGNREKSGR